MDQQTRLRPTQAALLLFSVCCFAVTMHAAIMGDYTFAVMSGALAVFSERHARVRAMLTHERARRMIAEHRESRRGL